jgi:hypothetical protein
MQRALDNIFPSSSSVCFDVVAFFTSFDDIFKEIQDITDFASLFSFGLTSKSSFRFVKRICFNKDRRDVTTQILVAIALHAKLNDLAKFYMKYWHSLSTPTTNNDNLKLRTLQFIPLATGNLVMIRWFLNESIMTMTHANFGLALLSECIEVLEWLKYEYADTFNKEWKDVLCFLAIKHGKLELLKWARLQDCRWDESMVCLHASASGHLNILQWARTSCVPVCPWNNIVCEAAADRGDIKMLQWLIDNGCEMGDELCLIAANSDRFGALKWLREEKKCNWDGRIFAAAAKLGNLSMMIWALENGCPDFDMIPIHEIATVHHRKEILLWIKNRSVERVAGSAHQWNPSMFALAILGVTSDKDISFLRWLRNKGCPWNKNSTYIAAMTGHLGILKWLIRNGCPYSSNVYLMIPMQKRGALMGWMKLAGKSTGIATKL